MSLRILDEEWSLKTMSLEKYVREGNISWDFFRKDELLSILKSISESLEKEKDYIIYPSLNHIFRAFSVPLEKVRVVVIGQDPYHDGNAVGLCFSIPPKRKINPSLQNIYKELENEGYTPVKNGSLVHWAKQGCLMLNTALTVRKGEPESHLQLWSPFTKMCLEYVARNTQGVAWLLMGKHATAFKKYTEMNGHRGFITSHPSPLSAYRGFGEYPAFIGSGVFRKMDEFLEKKIEW